MITKHKAFYILPSFEIWETNIYINGQTTIDCERIVCLIIEDTAHIKLGLLRALIRKQIALEEIAKLLMGVKKLRKKKLDITHKYIKFVPRERTGSS